MKKYWFKPKRFWKFFAAYYPASWQGWVVSLLILAVFCWLFFYIDKDSHSVSDTLISFSPFAIALLCIFDVISFRTGEHPSWWRKNGV